MEDTNLSHEARAAIRKYMVHLITLPGSIMLVLSFTGGFFTQQIAHQKAEIEAKKTMGQNIVELNTDIRNAKEKIADNMETFKVLGGVLRETITDEQGRISAITAEVETARLALDHLATTDINELGQLINNDQDLKKAIAELSEKADQINGAGDISAWGSVWSVHDNTVPEKMNAGSENWHCIREGVGSYTITIDGL